MKQLLSFFAHESRSGGQAQGEHLVFATRRVSWGAPRRPNDLLASHLDAGITWEPTQL